MQNKEIKYIRTNLVEVHEDLVCLVSDLPINKRNELERSIIDNGIEIPLLVGRFNMSTYIIDGHHRWEVAMEQDIENIPVIFKDYETLEEMKLDTIRSDYERRQLTSKEEAKLALEIKELKGLSFRKAAEETGVSKERIYRADKEVKEKKAVEERLNQAEETALKVVNDIPKSIKIPTVSLVEETAEGFRKEILTKNEVDIHSFGYLDACKPSIANEVNRISARDAAREARRLEEIEIRKEQEKYLKDREVKQALHTINRLISNGDLNIERLLRTILQFGFDNNYFNDCEELETALEYLNDLADLNKQ